LILKGVAEDGEEKGRELAVVLVGSGRRSLLKNWA